MMEISELRARLRAVSPVEALEQLARVLESPKTPEDFDNPLVTVNMRSGMSFKGYLVSAGHSPGETENHFMISLQITKDTDDARDVAYVSGRDIESVFFFDIDPIIDYLPAR